MHNKIKMLLNLFGDGGEGSAAGTAGSANGGQSGTEVPVAPTRRQKSATESIIYGKQDAAQPDEAKKAEEPKKTVEERRKAFQDLINGEYKDLYTESTQQIINKRFKEAKEKDELIGKQKAVLDTLMGRYGVATLDDLNTAIDSDDAMWQEAADEAGMTVKQFKEFKKLEKTTKELLELKAQNERAARQNEIIQEWKKEETALKERFPDFNLEAEMQNQEFVRMISHGTPIEHAYKALHFDEIMSGALQEVTKTAEKRVVDNIRARGARPQENGLSSTATATIKDDVTRLTREDREDIARRVRRGEIISF